MIVVEKITNPLGNIFNYLQDIILFMEVKDKKIADKEETKETKRDSAVWLAAMSQEDSYITYKDYWQTWMFQDVLNNVKLSNVEYWMNNPFNVPLDFREYLTRRCREIVLNTYEEANVYYRTRIGLPPIGSNIKHFLSKELAKNYGVDPNIPIHKLPLYIQNKFVSTEEYLNLMLDYPDDTYLEYIGKYKCDLFQMRRAKDYEIIRYPKDDTSININILREFGSLYSDYRNYVMETLYVRGLEDAYENYREYMGLLILMFALMQFANKNIEYSNTLNPMDESMMYLILSKYGIDSDILISVSERVKLVNNLPKLVYEKGTSEVYRQLIKLLDYPKSTTIEKLMMNKTNGTITFLNLPSEISDIYNSVIGAETQSYDKVTGSDETWWETKEVQDILKDSKFSNIESKYIDIKSSISQTEAISEFILFTKMVLDQKAITNNMYVSIPSIFGAEEIPLYDCMIFLVTALCMRMGTSGNIIQNDERLLSVAGFNFDADTNEIQKYLKTHKLPDETRIIELLHAINISNIDDLESTYESSIRALQTYLMKKISDSSSRNEYRVYSNIYKAIFTYDINKNTLLDDYQKPDEIIQDKYNVTADELLEFKHFYPRTITGKAITVEGFKTSQYKNPFLAYKNDVTWYIDLGKKGILYFHDILNSPDLRYLKNEKDEYIFLLDKDTVDEETVRLAIQKLSDLSSDELNRAFFQIDTVVLGKSITYPKEKELPKSIRNKIFKDILIDKLIMDILGYEEPPVSYSEYLDRKNTKLYDLLMKEDRFHKNYDAWLSDVSTVLVGIEKSIGLHVKYVEEYLVGKDLFFEPLVKVINRFKSAFVTINKTSIEYVVDDKVDIGGNLNSLHLFDAFNFTVNLVFMNQKGTNAEFGLYDTIHASKSHRVGRDSFGMHDEVMCYKNNVLV